MTEFCSLVKRGTIDFVNFEDFLAHVSECNDCQRRIASQIEIDFNQRTMENNKC